MRTMKITAPFKNSQPLNQLVYMFVAAALLSACQSHTIPRDNRIEFKTRIVDNTLKQFNIFLVQPKRAQGIDLRDVSNSANQKRRKQINKGKKVRSLLAHHLNEKIEENNFCKEGYWIISEDPFHDIPYLRGECNDAATAEDIATFTNRANRR